MKRSGYAIMAAVLTAAMLSACGGTSASDTSTAPASDVAETVSSAASEAAESDTVAEEEIQTAGEQDEAENSEADTSESSNALIVYFDYSENMGDTSGKTIVPFGIHLGSRFGKMIDQIKEAEPGATVIEDGLTENSHTPNDQVISDVDSWLEGLNLEN